jgi:hypothetical protein
LGAKDIDGTVDDLKRMMQLVCARVRAFMGDVGIQPAASKPA